MSQSVDILLGHMNTIKLLESCMKLTTVKNPPPEDISSFLNSFESVLTKIPEDNNVDIILQMKLLIEKEFLNRKKIKEEDVSIKIRNITEHNTIPESSNRTHSDNKNPNKDGDLFDELNILTDIHANGLNDVSGYDNVKKTLKMSVIWPLKHPRLFANQKNIRTILLYGPPGTGKSHLVHALAAEANAKLFSVLSSNILSSYIGKTEKAVNAIFSKLKDTKEVTILFIDEVDGLFMKRKDNEFDHSRRLKTELMCHLSNFNKNENTFFIGATNRPWDLDSAFLRRFKKVLYIPLPNHKDRREILKVLTKDIPLITTHPHWEEVIQKTEGFSCSDLESLIEHASSKPLSSFCDTSIWKEKSKKITPWDAGLDDTSEDTILCPFDDMPADFDYELRKPVIEDVVDALSVVRRTVSLEESRTFENYANNAF